jgi:Cu(I)/Ag(I) efflux system membrane protein CusA/SilA
MVETTVRLKPRSQWRKKHGRTITMDELSAEMNAKMQLPGWTNAFTMPIKTRVDMLTTGVRTPIGVKVLGTDLAEIEAIGTTLERLLEPIRGTRSVLYERNLGGLYLDIIPDPDALARYGLRVEDVNRTIETAIGGMPITVTIEGRQRFSVNVRYPRNLRDDLEALRQVLVPVGAPGGGMGERGELGAWPSPRFAQMDMGEPAPNGGAAARPGGARPSAATDATAARPPLEPSGGSGGGRIYVPLGELADIRIVGGPPMVRDEDGLLVGYVYVDIDQGERDIGGYVDEAKRVVAGALADGRLTMPTGTFLEWTGQYELLEKMVARMKIVVPVTLLIIVLLLFAHFKNAVEVLIVLLSIPFALVGSVWLLWFLDFRLSTAVWVGVIALVGLAAQTGIVMIVYIDNAYRRRKEAGKIRDLNDIIWAHMEGTVMRVRPKLMTVSTMLIGLMPLLWATGSGADVMKRIAAPMVGGLITSTFLTLEIIPVIYTYWRKEQLLHERLAGLDAPRLRRLKTFAAVLAAGWALLAAFGVSLIYLSLPAWANVSIAAVAGAAIAAGTVAYLWGRPGAHRLVWPASG